MTLEQQITDFGRVHDITWARRQVNDYIHMRHVPLMLGLSAISTGLDQIARGRAEEGLRVAQHGLDFLQAKIEEASDG